MISTGNIKNLLQLLTRCSWIIFCLLIISISVIPYMIFLWSWIAISMAFSDTLFHRVEDRLWGWYQRQIVFFFEHCTGVEIFISGTIPHMKENVLVISNHQSSMDWIIADFLAIRQSMVGNMRYVFKSSLKYYPLFGYGFGVHGGVFVRRDGKYNDRNMRQVFQTLIQRKADLYFTIYPEGTRFNPKRNAVLEKSQSYAIKNGFKPLKQVLTPRVKAFECALDALKTYIHAIYDITIMYDTADGIDRPQPPSVFQFLCGDCKKVYVHFERIPVKDAISSITKLASDEKVSSTMKWLHQRFEMKDELMMTFYKQGCKSENSESCKVLRRTANSHLISTTNFKRSVVPLWSTLPATLGFALVNLLFLRFPLGRWLYVLTSTVGTVLCAVYAHFLL